MIILIILNQFIYLKCPMTLPNLDLPIEYTSYRKILRPYYNLEKEILYAYYSQS